MKNIDKIISQIIDLQSKLDELGGFEVRTDERLWQKFRLEWNYNSNHIEGNTLTYGETMQLLIKGQTTGDHDVREYDEMRAHDVAVEVIKKMAFDNDRFLSEADVRELNTIILVKEFWKEAITSSGQATKKKILPGVYKSTPNHVLLPNGETFYYAKPVEVAAKMKELLDWYRVESKDLHPIEVAAILHHRFVLIHPFDDGNGRVARLLMNYELMKHGYPPVIIKSDDKFNYLFALGKADAGDIYAFVKYIGNQLTWSMNLSLKAAKGISIEEAEDWKKHLKLIKDQANANQLNKAVKRSDSLMKLRVEDSIVPLLKKIELELADFDELFDIKERQLIIGQGVRPLIKYHQLVSLLFDQHAHKTGVNYLWQNYKYNNTNVFNLEVKVNVEFAEYQYNAVLVGTTFRISSKRYDEIISQQEIEQFVNEIGRHVMTIIKKNTN